MRLHLLRRPLAHIAALSFFVNLLLLTPAIFMLQVFDRVLASQSGDTLLVLVLGVGIALLLMLMLDHLRGRLQGVAGNLAVEALSPTVARVMLAQGARRLGSPPSEGLRDVAAMRTLFSSQGLLALFDAPWVVVYVGVIWLAHPTLGMAATLSALDEPNANLDGAGEQALADTLKDLRGNATVVVVTHRNTLIRHVDKMLVLEAGRVAHFGETRDVVKLLQSRAHGLAAASAGSGARVVELPHPAGHGATPGAIGGSR